MSDKATILAVDDASESLAQLVQTLTTAGYQVLQADSGELALAAVAARPPDLILLALRMKGMDGLEVCWRLKAGEETRRIPIILMSAFSEVKEWVAGLQLGAADYVTKPYQTDQLLARVGAHLALSRANASLEQQVVALRRGSEQLKSEILRREELEDALREDRDRGQRSRRAMLSALEDQKRADEELRRQSALTRAINRVLLETLVAPTTAEVARICLAAAEELTGSRFGWIGEANASGRLDTIAVTSPDWRPGSIDEFPGGHMFRNMEIGGILSRVLRDGKSVIANDPTTPAARAGLPDDHTGLTAFLGVPLKHSGQTTGMIALANKPLGYTLEDQDALEMLSVAFVQALEHKRVEEEIRRREEEVSVLYHASRRFGETLELDQVYDVLAESVANLVPCDVLCVSRNDPETQSIRGVMAWMEGSRLDASEWTAVPLAQTDLGVLGQVIEAGAGMVCDDFPLHRTAGVAQHDEGDGGRISPQIWPDGQATQSCLAAPIRVKGQVAGVIQVFSYQRGAYTPAHLQLVEALLPHASAALENARLFEGERAARDQAEKLQAATQALGATLDLQQVFARILSELRHVVPYDSASVQELKGDRLEIIGGHGFPNLEQILGVSFDLSSADNPNCEVVRTREALILDDASVDYAGFRREPHARARIRAWLGVPLLFGDRVIGLISLDKHEPAFYTGEHARLVLAFAAQAAVAIENARLYQEAQRQLRDLALLFETSAALSASLHLETVLHTISQHVVTALGVESCVIYRWDREQDAMVTLLHYAPDPGWKHRAAPGDLHHLSKFPAVRRVLDSHQPIAVRLSDPGADPDEVAWMRADKVISVLLVPLVIRDQALGLLELIEAHDDRVFSPSDISLCQTMANQAATAMHNARMYDEAQRRNRELSLLNRVIAATAAETGEGLEVVLEIVCRELALALELPQVAAALFNRERTEAVVVAEHASEGRPPSLGATIPVADDSAFQQLLRRPWPPVIEDVQTGARPAPVDYPLRQQGRVSELFVPLVLEGEVVGSLGMNASEPRAFSADEANLVVRVAEQVSGVLARVRLQERQQQIEDQFYESQKLEAVGRLAGGVAHDFNNLLTIIQLSARLLGRGLYPQDPLRVHVQRIEEAGQRAANLTKQLLAFSRREIIAPIVLDLNQSLIDLDMMLRRLIEEDVEMSLHLGKDLWRVKIDPTHVEQVIVNLVVNARDAMPTGGRLTIETANVTLDETYAAQHLGVEPGEYVLLAVSDTGTGMTDDVKAHLFEPFFTTKEKGKGTGLGLSAVFGIVKQNRGHIQAYSDVGQGATLRIYLPRATEGGPAPSRPLQPATARGTETLLLVEDERQVRELTRDILLGLGYQVLTAGDGAEALRVAEAHEGPIHLLLTDVVMPLMGGVALAEHFGTTRPDTRVLFTSGYTDEAIVRRGVLVEGTPFLSKPFELAALAQKVRSVLDAEAQATR